MQKLISTSLILSALCCVAVCCAPIAAADKAKAAAPPAAPAGPVFVSPKLKPEAPVAVRKMVEACDEKRRNDIKAIRKERAAIQEQLDWFRAAIINPRAGTGVVDKKGKRVAFSSGKAKVHAIETAKQAIAALEEKMAAIGAIPTFNNPFPEEMAVEQIGTLPNCRVVQIAGPTELIVDIGRPDHIVLFAQTKDRTPMEALRFTDVFVVVGKKMYQLASGGTKTLFILTKFDINKCFDGTTQTPL